MDEAHAVTERLERIGRLDRAGADPERLLGELRALVGEAEAWARAEGDERARRAAAGVGEALLADQRI